MSKPKRPRRDPILWALALVLLCTGAGFGGDRFGDSTATAARICSNSSLVLGKYLSAANGGVLDSIRIWSRNNDGGTDTLVACIYSAGGTLLGRSRDSVVVPNDNLSPYLLHFDQTTITINGSTRYWIGTQIRAAGTSTNSRIGTASSTDSLYLGSDDLPLENSLSSGSKYLGSGVEAIRITAYYSAHNAANVPARRRRFGDR
jgi:hypothetical protein